MIMTSNLILILVFVFSVVLAGLFAGAETGMYQMSRLRLRLGIERKKLSFVMLGKVLRDSSGLLISMLVGTNLAQYIATSTATYILLIHFNSAHTTAFFTTLLITPVLFVFSELLPKNIFFYRADSAMPPVAGVLLIFHKLFIYCGIVPMLKGVSSFFARVVGKAGLPKVSVSSLRSSHFEAVFHETREEGLLSTVQSDIIKRLTNISHISIKTVMTPISKVESISFDSDRGALLDILRKSSSTRLPVWKDAITNITGFVNIYQCLTASEQFCDLSEFIKPIRMVSADTSVIEAINLMQAENQKIVLVTRASHSVKQKPLGIVTMKDLAEELLGELVEW